MPSFSKNTFFHVGYIVFALLAGCGGGGNDDSSAPDQAAPSITASAKVGTEAVVLSAEVNDNVAVTEVEFLIDGGAITATVSDSAGRSVYTASISLDRFANGSHTLAARAHDAAGNVGKAVDASFVVDRGISVDSPIKVTGSSTKDGGSVTFTIDIESEETISLTNFFLDGEFIGGRGDDQRHYVLTRSLSSGTHRLVVDVSDAKGHSAQVEVIVEV